MTKKRQLTIIGILWDHQPLLKILDTLFESKYITFYKPWLKGKIKKEKIMFFKEKYKTSLLWFFKIIVRSYRILKIIKKFKPNIIISHHDDAIISTLPVMLFFKKLNIKKLDL